MARTRPLDPIEIRVLGALMEKEQTTPDHYPLTIHGVIAACNQKSNRHPVMSLTETQVVETLDRLRQDVLTWRSEGARVERWEQRLDRRWQLTPASKAVMCLLMLRGPQTPGELKGRSERMHPFASREEVEAVLKTLSEGFDSLVRELARSPGQRESRWTHTVSVEEPAETLAASVPQAEAVEQAPPVPQGPTPVERLDRLEAAVEELREELRSLRVRLGDLD